MHHHLLEAVSETANVLELIQTNKQTSIHNPLWVVVVVVVVYRVALPKSVYHDPPSFRSPHVALDWVRPCPGECAYMRQIYNNNNNNTNNNNVTYHIIYLLSLSLSIYLSLSLCIYIYINIYGECTRSWHVSLPAPDDEQHACVFDARRHRA